MMNAGWRFAKLVPAVLLAAGLGACAPADPPKERTAESKGEVMKKKSLGAKTLPTAPVWAVGSYDQAGKPNAMTAAWVGICCSKPPCVAVSLRKATYTHGNILARKAFTVSIPSEAFAKQADYFGLVSGRNEDKFAGSGLTPVKSELVDAPYVGEFPLIVECKLLNSFELGLHTMFVGEIVDVKADPAILGPDGSLDAGKLKPFLFDPGSRQYFKLGEPLGKAFEAGKVLIKPAGPAAK